MLTRDLLLFFIPVNSMSYAVAWETTLPLVLVCHGVAGISCYRAIAGLYPGIGRFAVMLFAGALAVTFVLSLCGLPLELKDWRAEPTFRAVLVAYRWVDTLLAGGLALAVAFLSRFPSPLRRLPANLVRHTSLLAAYFSLYAITTFQPFHTEVAVSLRMALVCCLYLTWTVTLAKTGEEWQAWPVLDSGVLDWMIERHKRMEGLYGKAARQGWR